MLKSLMVVMLLINVAACVLFGCARAACWLSDLAPSARYTELDRAGVINQEALKAYSPALAANDRYNVPTWIAESALSAEKRHAEFALGIAVFNSILAGFVLLAIGLQATRSTPSSEGPGPPSGGPSPADPRDADGSE